MWPGVHFMTGEQARGMPFRALRHLEPVSAAVHQVPGDNVAQIAAAKRIEDIAGGVNILLALITAFIGVWKPKL